MGEGTFGRAACSVSLRCSRSLGEAVMPSEPVGRYPGVWLAEAKSWGAHLLLQRSSSVARTLGEAAIALSQQESARTFARLAKQQELLRAFAKLAGAKSARAAVATRK